MLTKMMMRNRIHYKSTMSFRSRSYWIDLIKTSLEKEMRRTKNNRIKRKLKKMTLIINLMMIRRTRINLI